jgi:hypothetical protein
MFDFKTVLVSLAGSGLLSVSVVMGLSKYLGDRWMARYKSGLDQQLEAYKDALERKRKRIESELGHRTYVSKTQFDTEYGALKECFAALGKLRLSFNGLRPMIDWTPEDAEEKARLVLARLSRVTERFNPFIELAESVYPFVPSDIYEQFEICMKAVFTEIKHIESDIYKALTPAGYNNGQKQRERFDQAYFAAARLARQHFQQISIVSE